MASCASSSSAPCGLTCLQTDDTARSVNGAFLQKESIMASWFDCKHNRTISNGAKISLNGTGIGITSSVYSIDINDHINKLQERNMSNVESHFL